MVGATVVDKRQKSTPVSFLLSERSSPFHVDRFSLSELSKTIVTEALMMPTYPRL